MYALDLLLPPTAATLEHLIDKIYLDIDHIHDQSNDFKAQYFSERVILAARNVEVDTVNESILERLPGESRTYTSADSAFIDGVLDERRWGHEYLNTIVMPGMPLHSTILKVGCPIILLRNLDPSAGLCNGTRMIITGLRDHVLEARVLTGSHAGTTAFIPRISLSSSSSSGLPFILRRRQFPIRIAFAMTINKAQGQSLRVVGLYLPIVVFTHGQLYVALSRCTDCRNLYILLSIEDPRITLNPVYKEVFRG